MEIGNWKLFSRDEIQLYDCCQSKWGKIQKGKAKEKASTFFLFEKWKKTFKIYSIVEILRKRLKSKGFFSAVKAKKENSRRKFEREENHLKKNQRN